MANRSACRDRFPSFDVQQETRAALASAYEKKQLPTHFGDIQGLVVTEKNTFINIEASIFEDSDCDKDLAEFPSPILHRRDRKQTEGVLLSPVRERNYSSLLGARSRRSSCPPKIVDEFFEKRVVAVAVLPSNVSTSRRHYSIDVMNHAPLYGTTSPLSVKPIDETCATLSSTPTEAPKTTLMLRNVPYSESQLGVLALIEDRGFKGKFDFFYAPLDFCSGNNLGYAFINLPSRGDVDEFITVFDGLRLTELEAWSQKDLQVCWARVQGSEPNVEHYRNSPVNDMPENFRPMIFSNGEQLPFPRPDENAIRRPLPSTVYSGNRATNRPRFASAQFTSPFPQRTTRKVSFHHRPPTPSISVKL